MQQHEFCATGKDIQVCCVKLSLANNGLQKLEVIRFTLSL